jgi:hypothetical protein
LVLGSVDIWVKQTEQSQCEVTIFAIAHERLAAKAPEMHKEAMLLIVTR